MDAGQTVIKHTDQTVMNSNSRGSACLTECLSGLVPGAGNAHKRRHPYLMKLNSS